MSAQKDFTIIYADDTLAVLNKRSGLAVAADRYDPDAPRLDMLAQTQLGNLFAVHRIDKDTSGLVLYARTEAAQKSLCTAFENRAVQKTYHALVYGHPLWNTLHTDFPLTADADARHRTIVNRKSGKPSVTNFKCLGNCGPFSWLEAQPVTGRTHQIRVHSAQNGFPIVCDPLYGASQKPVRLSELKRSWRGNPFEERPLLSRLALHAFRLEFKHPKTEKATVFYAPYPKDLEALRKQLFKLYKIDPLAHYEL
ncbi:RluA family pseudouridine synthase [Treponema sp. OMZ 840]|uniref:RluA family pseudouridine synthase n=1 Tax=Treponema sp. OMZ 840 TaxID=244313 RepID=UPI003D90C6FB